MFLDFDPLNMVQNNRELANHPKLSLLAKKILILYVTKNNKIKKQTKSRKRKLLRRNKWKFLKKSKIKSSWVMALRLFNEKNEKIRNEKNGKSKRNLYQNLNKKSKCV